LFVHGVRESREVEKMKRSYHLSAKQFILEMNDFVRKQARPPKVAVAQDSL